MTVNLTENKTELTSNQEKVDTKEIQQKIDNTTNEKVQQPIEDKNKEEAYEDPNFKAFREGRKKDRAAREAAEALAAQKEQEISALKAAMEAAFSKSAPSPQAYQQYYGTNNQAFGNHGFEHEEETEDQRIEKKVSALLAAKEENQRRQQEERERTEYPNRLVKDFNDFNSIVSQENLDYMDYHYPEVSRPLQRLGDGYDKWADIYRAIKKFVPNNTNSRRDAAKAEANFNKPKSISSTTLTPNGEGARSSWQETEQRRTENWQRMQRMLKGV